MKKILAFLVTTLFFLSGMQVFAADTGQKINTGDKIEINKTVNIQDTVFKEEKSNGYVELNVKGGSSYLMEAGRPSLPKVSKVFEIPFGAQNVKVKVKPVSVQNDFMNLEQQINPAYPLVPYNYKGGKGKMFEKDKTVYSSDNLYPSDWFNYDIAVGLNEEKERVSHVCLHLFPLRYNPSDGKVVFTDSFDVSISYKKPVDVSPVSESEYDMVVIAPKVFSNSLQRLIEHKNDMGIKTFLKTTEGIYDEYNGVDKPEQIKYFIKDMIETYNITYVLLVGGLNSKFCAQPRDTVNYGAKDWYVPVRYTNLYDQPKHPLSESKIHDPGVISDLYYADIYKENGSFSSWDPNGDGVFAAWAKPGVENDTNLDLCPDVAVGRLACRNRIEVNTVINKIINYEKNGCDPSWFNRMTVISGDGFLDQEDLDFQWDVKNVDNGRYTIYGQSINKDGITGKIDKVHITVDKSKETSLSFTHNDHLQVRDYPARPITEITSPSNGDVIGMNGYLWEPTSSEAYCNSFTGWANVSYIKDTLHIRGKSYDPRPYGNVTDVHVWIKNNEGETVYSEWRNNTEMYYEGEWATGEKTIDGRGGALHYMPEDFKKNILWTSNGKFTGPRDVIKAFNQGNGFVFMSGHGSPNVWADHYPGIPGNRQHGEIIGLETFSITPPFLPMQHMLNFNQLPVVVVGGCHNSEFNVSMIHSMTDIFNNKKMWTYGMPVSECFSWRMVSLPRRGAIASIGNTGLGYGRMGDQCLTGGGDAWITVEFFRQYGEEGQETLGMAHSQAINHYVQSFNMSNLEEGHAKTVQQWALLGDPSLKLGGYQ